MKRILSGCLALGISLSPLTVSTVAQQTSSQQNLRFLGIANQGDELLAQAPDARKAEADRLFEQGKKLVPGTIDQLEAALAPLQQSLSIYQEIGDRRGERAALYYLGTAYLGHSLKAIEYYQQSWAIDREIGSPPADVLRAEAQQFLESVQIGDVVDVVKLEKISLPLLQKALTTFKELKDHSGESQALHQLGHTYYELGEYAKAIEYYQQSWAIDRESPSADETTNYLRIMGFSHLQLGKYNQAIKFFQRGLAHARKSQNRYAEENALKDLGEAYYHLKNYTKAIEYFQQSWSVTQKLNNAPVIKGEYLLQAGHVLTNLGAALFRSGKLAEAEKTLLSAIKFYEELMSKGDNLWHASIFDSRPYYLLQQVLVDQNKLNSALEIAERGKARAFVQLLSQQLSSSTVQETVTPPNIQKIKQIAQEQNATLVKYSIIEDYFKVQGKLQIQESELFIWVVKPTGEITFHRTDLKPLSQQENFFDRFWQAYLGIWSHPMMTAILIIVIGLCIRLAIRRRRLAPWLLLFLAAGSGTVGSLWLGSPNPVSRDVTTRSEQQPKTPLAELVSSTRESIQVGNRGLAEIASGKTRQSQKERLQQFYKLLIKPIANLLPTDPNARVIFIPHKDLFFVPFPALQDANGQHLIEKYTIVIAPSIQTLELTHQRRQELAARYAVPLQPQDALVVGNPTMPKIVKVFGDSSEQLKPLPSAEQEAKEIAMLLNTQAIIGNQATEAAMVKRMLDKRIIHLATHGLLDAPGGFLGAIALAPSGKYNVLSSAGVSLTRLSGTKEETKDDGLLTAQEILKLKLNAELFVLSACDTGRGLATGDGVIGLSRSLFAAGVPSVVVSLWAVPDAPTAFLMTNFYKNLQKQPDKAQALRQAMLTTMKQHPDPRNWAAFMLIGEAE
jgi:CHAT domain-containing protein